MKNIIFFFLLFIFLSCNNKVEKLSSDAPVFDNSKTLERITFGSCNDQNRDQKIWPYIVQNDPDLWIWLGDNIYADTEDMEVMAAKYAKQKNNAGYQSLRTSCPVIGIWDDHDYGKNDAGKEYPKKVESKKLMLDFLDVPANAVVRRKTEGAYQTYTYGPKDKQVKVILLDARYFRDDLTKDEDPNRRYDPNPTGEILGEAQWKWLEAELTNSKAKVHIIGSGIQFIPEEHGWEKWANYPKDRKRFFDLIAKTKPMNPLLISGDRHIAELSKYQPAGLDYPVYEMTSSGLTHTWGTPRFEANKHRVGEMIYERNFGLLQIDWSKNTPQLTVEVKGLENKSYLKETLKY